MTARTNSGNDFHRSQKEETGNTKIEYVRLVKGATRVYDRVLVKLVSPLGASEQLFGWRRNQYGYRIFRTRTENLYGVSPLVNDRLYKEILERVEKEFGLKHRDAPPDRWSSRRDING